MSVDPQLLRPTGGFAAALSNTDLAAGDNDKPAHAYVDGAALHRCPPYRSGWSEFGTSRAGLQEQLSD